MADTQAQLLALLDKHGARYRLMAHAPEGRTDRVSAMRGNALPAAAKCIILMVKLGKKVTRYVLAVVPGDARVDLEAIKRLVGGTYAAFAAPAVAEALAGSPAGTVLPFAFHPDLRLVVDPALLAHHPEIFFNAARLDQSLALSTDDYMRLAKPEVAVIRAPAEPGA